MLGFDIEPSKNLLRKISQVAGYDDAGAAADRGCQYVAILRVREDKTGNEVLVSCYERVSRCLVHELSCTLQFFAREIGTVGQEAAHPFCVNVC